MLASIHKAAFQFKSKVRPFQPAASETVWQSNSKVPVPWCEKGDPCSEISLGDRSHVVWRSVRRLSAKPSHGGQQVDQRTLCGRRLWAAAGYYGSPTAKMASLWFGNEAKKKFLQNMLPDEFAITFYTSNGSWCIGIKGEMSGTVCVTFTWDIYIYKQRVLMHRHQGWNVRHGLCHIYMRYLYIWVVYSFCFFVVCSLL